MDGNDYKIFNITQAYGWYARFQHQDDTFQLPIVCWAVIDNDDIGLPVIKGMMALDESDMLWTPHEVESYYSSTESPDKNRVRFLEYAQISNDLSNMSTYGMFRGKQHLPHD